MPFQHIKKTSEKNYQKTFPVKHNFVWVSNCMPKYIKTNDPVPRKCLDRETNIQKDGHTLLY